MFYVLWTEKIQMLSRTPCAPRNKW